MNILYNFIIIHKYLIISVLAILFLLYTGYKKYSASVNQNISQLNNILNTKVYVTYTKNNKVYYLKFNKKYDNISLDYDSYNKSIFNLTRDPMTFSYFLEYVCNNDTDLIDNDDIVTFCIEKSNVPNKYYVKYNDKYLIKDKNGVTIGNKDNATIFDILQYDDMCDSDNNSIDFSSLYSMSDSDNTMPNLYGNSSLISNKSSNKSIHTLDGFDNNSAKYMPWND